MRWKQPVKLQQRDNEVISCPVTPHSVRDLGFGDGLTDRVDLCEASKKEIKDILIQYGRTLQVADPRCCESEEFGGPGARARYQKSYR